MEFNKVHIGNNEINKVYLGNNLVYNKVSDPNLLVGFSYLDIDSSFAAVPLSNNNNVWTLTSPGGGFIEAYWGNNLEFPVGAELAFKNSSPVGRGAFYVSPNKSTVNYKLGQGFAIGSRIYDFDDDAWPQFSPNIISTVQGWLYIVRPNATDISLYMSTDEGATRTLLKTHTNVFAANEILYVRGWIEHETSAGNIGRLYYPQGKGLIATDPSVNLLPGFSFIKPLGWLSGNDEIYIKNGTADYEAYLTTLLLPVGGEIAMKAVPNSEATVKVNISQTYDHNAGMGMCIDNNGNPHIYLIRGADWTDAEEGTMISNNYYILKRETNERLQIYTTTNGVDRILVDDGTTIASIIPGFVAGGDLYIIGEVFSSMHYLQGKGLLEIGHDLTVAKSVLQGAVTPNQFQVTAKLKADSQAKLKVYSNSGLTTLVHTSDLVNADAFDIVKFTVPGLTAGTRYWWKVVSPTDIASTYTGTTKTLPSGQSSYKVIASSCAGSGKIYSNHEVFEFIKNNHANAEMLIHMGDIFYLDNDENDSSIYDQAFDALLAQKRQQQLYLNMPLVYMADDHDYASSNSDSTNPARPAFFENYKRRMPHYDLPLHSNGAGAYCQSFAIGRVRFIMLDTRSQRIQGTTILGATQKQWLKDTMLNASEKVFLVMVGVPWIGTGDEDTWGSVSSERTEIMNFLSANSLNSKTILFAGDAHMVAIDDGTNNSGIPVFQFAALDSDGEVKGGPYSHGTYTGRSQFGVFEITDAGSTITVKGTGYRVSGGSATQLTTYTKVFTI